MNPDRGAEIGLQIQPAMVGLPRELRILPLAVRLFLATITASASATALGVRMAEAVDSKCRVGLGLQVEPEFYANGARISVIESGFTRRQELLDPTKERVIDLGIAPSNTTKDGKDGRVVVHFATDQQGRQLTPPREAEVNCGKYEHVKYVRIAPNATPASGSTLLPSVTPTPDRVATLEAEERGRKEILATVTAAAAVTSTAGTSGRPGFEINLPAKLPVEGMPDGASLAAVIASIIAAFGLAFDRPNRLRTRFGNTIAFPFREIRYRLGPLRAHNQGLNDGTIPAGTPAPVRGYPGIWGV